MLAQTKLRPGQPGTGKLTAQFAAQLICVQYQCAAQSHRRYQAAEIIIEKAPWHPPEKLTAEKESIGLRIASRKTENAATAQAGRRWNLELNLREISRAQALRLRLKDRIQKLKTS